MRVAKKSSDEMLEGDLTPMIDMTFQLIAFFMVLINFAQTEQNDRVKLPESELAKPPEAPVEFPITMHLGVSGTVDLGDRRDIVISTLDVFLSREKSTLAAQGKTAKDATIVIRAHHEADTGRVQELIKECQENGFEKFALRAKEDVGN